MAEKNPGPFREGEVNKLIKTTRIKTKLGTTPKILKWTKKLL